MRKSLCRCAVILAACAALCHAGVTDIRAAGARLNRTSLTVALGGSARLKVTGARGRIRWSSSRPSVAAVSQSGKVSGRKCGSAVVRAAAGGRTLSCRVKVRYRAAAAAKKISVSYREAPNCVIAVCKNGNRFPVSLEGSMAFLDASGNAVGVAECNNRCLGAGRACVLLYGAPRSGYASYRGSVRNSLSEYEDCAPQILAGAELQAVGFTLTAANASGKCLNVIRVSCLLYDGGGRLCGCVQKYVSCHGAGTNRMESVDYPAGCPAPDRVKVCVDCAYQTG